MEYKKSRFSILMPIDKESDNILINHIEKKSHTSLLVYMSK